MHKLLLQIGLLVGLAGIFSCTSTLYLVRHAEKSAEAQDPGLTEVGQARAASLAERMARKNIEAIWSTPYRRTLMTAEPLRLQTQRPIQTYRNLDSLAAVLREFGKNALIVGHSNTTPDLARRLGASPSMQMIPDSTYDLLFIVRIPGNSKGRVRLKETTY